MGTESVLYKNASKFLFEHSFLLKLLEYEVCALYIVLQCKVCFVKAQFTRRSKTDRCKKPKDTKSEGKGEFSFVHNRPFLISLGCRTKPADHRLPGKKFEQKRSFEKTVRAIFVPCTFGTYFPLGKLLRYITQSCTHEYCVFKYMCLSFACGFFDVIFSPERHRSGNGFAVQISFY